VSHKAILILIVAVCLVLTGALSVHASSLPGTISLSTNSRFAGLGLIDVTEISVASLQIGQEENAPLEVVALQTETAASPVAKIQPSKSAASPSLSSTAFLANTTFRPVATSGAETGYINLDGTTRSDIETPTHLLSADAQLYKVTFYCACMECCGKTNAVTASMAPATAGVTVAASNTIPFGTRIWIEGYGERVVQDRGGAIGMNRLDIYVNTHPEALRHGVKNKHIWFL